MADRPVRPALELDLPCEEIPASQALELLGIGHGGAQPRLDAAVGPRRPLEPANGVELGALGGRERARELDDSGVGDDDEGVPQSPAPAATIATRLIRAGTARSAGRTDDLLEDVAAAPGRGLERGRRSARIRREERDHADDGGPAFAMSAHHRLRVPLDPRPPAVSARHSSSGSAIPSERPGGVGRKRLRQGAEPSPPGSSRPRGST